MEDVKVALVHHGEGQFDHLTFADGRHFQFPESAADAEDGRSSDLEVNIGAFVFDGEPEDLVDLEIFAGVECGFFEVGDEHGAELSNRVQTGTSAGRGCTGSVIEKRVPRPGSLSQTMCPWCASTMRRTVGSPRPLPPERVEKKA